MALLGMSGKFASDSYSDTGKLSSGSSCGNLKKVVSLMSLTPIMHMATPATPA